jgi:hypothetical protein
MAVRWRTARPIPNTISTIGTASTTGSKPVVASTTRTDAVSSVVRPSKIHACVRSKTIAPRYAKTNASGSPAPHLVTQPKSKS